LLARDVAHARGTTSAVGDELPDTTHRLLRPLQNRPATHRFHQNFRVPSSDCNFAPSIISKPQNRGTTIPVLTGVVDAQELYNYSNFNPNDDNDVSTSASLWRIQVGVSYSF